MMVLLEAVSAGDAAVGSIVRDSILGSVAVAGVAMAVWAIRVAMSAVEHRVKDAEAHADKLEKSNEKDRERMAEVMTTQRATTEALRDVANQLQSLGVLTQSQSRALEANTQAINGTIREAMGMRRAAGSSGASFPAVRTDKRKEEG